MVKEAEEDDDYEGVLDDPRAKRFEAFMKSSTFKNQLREILQKGTGGGRIDKVEVNFNEADEEVNGVSYGYGIGFNFSFK